MAMSVIRVTLFFACARAKHAFAMIERAAQ